ncbi:MAG: TIGR01777 family oxidoreductase [Paludibacter sp.]
MKKVVIAGGTGFIGTYLATRFREIGFKVLIVSRNPEHVSWLPNDLQLAVEGSELVINLAGKTINCRHNAVNRKAILESRIKSTKLIGDAISACNEPPKLWVNASASAIYKPSEEKAMTEDETDLATGFMADVVSKWESAFFEFELPKTRQVALRTSVVLGKNGGALKPLATLSRLGLGGKQADGTQIFSWLHIEDYFRIVQFLIKETTIQGVINCTSPNPLSNNDFMTSLRNTVSALFGIPAPRFAIVIGARLIGTEPKLLLDSSFLLPKRLVNSGFKFAFPTIDKALADLLK